MAVADEPKIMAEVGLPQMMRCKDTKGWHLAMQIMHGRELRQCVFYVLDKDVVVEPKQQVRGCGAVVSACLVGAVAAALAAVSQMDPFARRNAESCCESRRDDDLAMWRVENCRASLTNGVWSWKASSLA